MRGEGILGLITSLMVTRNLFLIPLVGLRKTGIPSLGLLYVIRGFPSIESHLRNLLKENDNNPQSVADKFSTNSIG